jgi:diguanylate cyclase (GGDEF)-like protein
MPDNPELPAAATGSSTTITDPRTATRQAWALIDQHPAQALELAQQALDSPGADPAALAFSHLIMGAAHARLGDFQAARPLLEAAQQAYQAQPGLEVGNLRLLSELGWCLLALGDDQAALDQLQQHQQLQTTIFSRDTSNVAGLQAELAPELHLAEQRRLLASQRVADRRQAETRAERLLAITRLVWDPTELRTNLPAVAGILAELCGASSVALTLPAPDNTGLSDTFSHGEPVDPLAPALAIKLGPDNHDYGALMVAFPEGVHIDQAGCQALLEAVAWQIGVTLRNERLHAAVNRLSVIDTLTGLYNRRYFITLAEQELKRTRRYDRSFSILLMDLDHFKAINDEHGVRVGDELLSQFAQLLQTNLRDTDVSARYGGEEFILLLPETGLSEALGVAGRLLYTLRAWECQSSAGPLSITMSIGVAGIIEQETITIDQLLDRADKALYQSKKNGRNRVTVWLDT